MPFDLVWAFLILAVPAIALPLPIAFVMQSFGPQRWAARRALLTSGLFAAAGYLALFAYYAISGIPDTIRSNPEASQTVAGQAVLGAFLVGGYASLAAFIYFYWHRNNPARGSQPR